MEEREREFLRIGWRLDALDTWRKDVDARLGVAEKQLLELVKADEIAEAVADKMNASTALHLSQSQRRWAFAFGALASVGSVAGVVSVVLVATGNG